MRRNLSKDPLDRYLVQTDLEQYLLECLAVGGLPLLPEDFSEAGEEMVWLPLLSAGNSLVALGAIRMALYRLQTRKFLYRCDDRYALVPKFQEPIVRYLCRTCRYELIYRQATSITHRVFSQKTGTPEDDFIRSGRHALLQNHLHAFQTYSDRYRRIHGQELIERIVLPFDAYWFSTLSPAARCLFWRTRLQTVLNHLQPLPPEEENILFRTISNDPQQSKIETEYLQYLLLRGDTRKLRLLLKGVPRLPGHVHFGALGVEAFMRGDSEAATTYFAIALSDIKHQTQGAQCVLTPFFECFRLLNGIARQDVAVKKSLPDSLAFHDAGKGFSIWKLLGHWNNLVENGNIDDFRVENALEITPSPAIASPLLKLFDAADIYWSRLPITPRVLHGLKGLISRSTDSGYAWIAREAAALRDVLELKKRDKHSIGVLSDLIRCRYRLDVVDKRIAQLSKTRWDLTKSADAKNLRREVARVVSQIGIMVPRDRLEEIYRSVEGLIVRFHADTNTVLRSIRKLFFPKETRTVDSRIHLRLFPTNGGIQVEFLVFPLGRSEEGCAPGAGNEIVIAEGDEYRIPYRRDFSLERRNLESILNACPVLKDMNAVKNRYSFDDLDQSYDFLASLQHLDPATVSIHWPHGKKHLVLPSVSFENLRLRFAAGNGWFEASGELKVGDTSIDLSDLLQATEATPGKHVRVHDRVFLSLTDEFRRKIEKLRLYLRRNGTSWEVNPLLVPAVERLLEPATTHLAKLETDEHWRQLVSRLRESENLVPDVPPTFQGRLRDYQIEGFWWLVKLATWGAGACLADDMGLGKSVQALALLLYRMNEGPALVVAPTSVCENWVREAARFAPSLKVSQLVSSAGLPAGDPKHNRAALIAAVGRGDLLITNYSMMQIEQDLLASKKFATVILDEAQAIKNDDTGRTQAAMRLQGDFRLIMTGTPLENHLGEFWSLFRFINPGLLGDRNEFERRFVVPIMQQMESEEGGSDDTVQACLKQTVQPFLLRRTKDEVLDELPPRTEIRLDVELSSEEAVLYEKTRDAAIQKIQHSTDKPGSKGNFQVLAELMRLRRLCCHPNLVFPKAKVRCSKLDLLEAVVKELVEGGHKALVYSQFVDYLKLIAARLDTMNLSYQYLDGSMTGPMRQKAIDAFQAGCSDLFLISLKAGGVGLNLTAADYVIHMDPWWNPAVENQASDRVHRIGQQRPVTIYRMVTKGTIEEKIIDLHRRKESLARQILGDIGPSSKVTMNQLMEILQPESSPALVGDGGFSSNASAKRLTFSTKDAVPVQSASGKKRGRPKGSGKYRCPTVPVRVPAHLIAEVQAFVLQKIEVEENKVKQRSKT